MAARVRLTRDMDSMIEEAYQTDREEIHDLAVQIQDLDTAHRRRRQNLLRTLVTATNRERHPPLKFSTVVTIVDAAPDEEAQLEAVMVRLAKRGEFDPLTAELAIATVGPHNTDAIVDFLKSLSIEEIEHTTMDCGKNLIPCVACEERLPARDVILASCGHCYCGSCISIMFEAAVSDESRYPPRCCGKTPIPVEHAKRFMEPGFERTFEEKGVEFNTVDRTYCSVPTCSTFIPPDTIERATASCPECFEETCVVCKAPDHGGDCPEDLELAAFLEYAEGMHWQRCHNCLSIVQRRDGCNHME